MRLDLLLAREPFADIFVDTLGDYLRARFNWQGEVRWHEKSGRLNKEHMLVHPHLNLIYPLFCQLDQLRFLASEYAYHPKLFRRVLQSLYVHYAVAPPFRHWLAGGSVDVSPWPGELSDWCILPGNHSIRMVDLARDECVVVRKKGFRLSFMSAQIELRRLYPELPVPRMIEADLEAGWLREQRVAGLPLNRLGDAAREATALGQAQAAMAALYRQTCRMVDCGEWIEALSQRLRKAAASIPSVYGKDFQERVSKAVKLLRAFLVRTDKRAEGIETVLTHGDFQPANILVPPADADSSLYLIDWEYTGRRCCWYDALVFALRSRFPADLASRIHIFVADAGFQRRAFEWCNCAGAEGDAVKWMVSLFLLEDLLLRLEENEVPGLRKKSVGLVTLIDEIAKVEWLRS